MARNRTSRSSKNMRSVQHVKGVTVFSFPDSVWKTSGWRTRKRGTKAQRGKRFRVGSGVPRRVSGEQKFQIKAVKPKKVKVKAVKVAVPEKVKPKKPVIPEKRRKAKDDFEEISKQLKMYDTVSPRPPSQIRQKALIYIDKLLRQKGLDKYEKFERMGRYLGGKEQLNSFLLDSWINGWDIRETVKEIKPRKEPKKPVKEKKPIEKPKPKKEIKQAEKKPKKETERVRTIRLSDESKTMPSRDEIEAEAYRMYMMDNPQFAATPERHELKEEGYLRAAQRNLMATGKEKDMTDDYINYLKRDLEERGYTIVPMSSVM